MKMKKILKLNLKQMMKNIIINLEETIEEIFVGYSKFRKFGNI